MQLRRLTGLERDKIEAEYQELVKLIARLRFILSDEKEIDAIIRTELLEIKKKFADTRRTEITDPAATLVDEDLIPDEDIVVTLTHRGYIKRLPLATYRSQRRGGRGIMALNTKEEDFVEHLFTTSTHRYVLFFTNKGRIFRLKGHEIPEAGRSARGTALINLVHIDKAESVNAVIPIRDYDDEHYLIMATHKGIIKKTVLSEFDSPRAGLLGITLEPDDELVGVKLTDGDEDVLLATRFGQLIRFPESFVRFMGRAARGVKGVRLGPSDTVIGMEVPRPGVDILVVTEHGYGKKTPLDEYRVTARGGKGIRTMNVTSKTGVLVGIKVVEESDEIMIISAEGVMIRLLVRDISRQGRSTQGVRLMRLGENNSVVAVALVASKDEDEG